MIARFSPVLRRALKRSLKLGELTPQQDEAVRKLLAARGKRKRDAWEQLTGQFRNNKKLISACAHAEEDESDTPIWDWIKANWAAILSAIIAIVMQFLL